MMLILDGNFRAPVAESRFLSKYAALLDLLLRVGDAVLVAIAAILGYWLRFGLQGMGEAYVGAVVRGVLLTLLTFPVFGLYRSWRGERLLHEAARLALALVATMAVLMFIAWATHRAEDYSRLWLTSWYGLALGMLLISRWLVRHALGRVRALGVDNRTVVVVGATEAGRRVVAMAKKSPGMGLDVVGCVQTPYDSVLFDDVPVIGQLTDCVSVLRELAPDQIWIALPMRAEVEIRQLVDALDQPVTIRLVPDLFGYELLSHRTMELAGVPVITLRGSPIEGHMQIFKAIEDRLLSLLLLLLLSPLMVMIAVGVKLSSPGPVFYRQKRHGLGGREIEVWKFRSMRVHAESDGKVTQAKKDDSRVTRFGRFLRSCSLDELPQLVNVLRGQMSIVGPRPHAVVHNSYYSERLAGYMRRHGVKPGLTGLAQVSGFRGETDSIEKMAQRVECDIAYINEWSLWLDLKIVLRTPLVLLGRVNAY
jgi:Undecaprenyl-phosphate glucose phosphotransferase